MAVAIVIGVIAWALMEQGKDLWRTARGEPPIGPAEHGFRGYLNDRWQALADRHHRNKAALDGTPDWWTRRRINARKKALSLGGFRTDEEIERAAWNHQRRIGLIRQGIDPDTAPPPPGAPALKRRRGTHDKHQPEDLDTTDVVGLTDIEPTRNPDPPGPVYTGAEVWLNPEYFDADGNPIPAAKREQHRPQGAEPWTPFNDKENQMTAGEINNPADVLAYHGDVTKALDAATAAVDSLTEVATALTKQGSDFTANTVASEHAAAGMDGLGMTGGAAAARSLVETQTAIAASLAAMVQAIETHRAALADQVEASRPHAAAIRAAYGAQLTVHDTRQGVGTGNLARDAYLDGDV